MDNVLSVLMKSIDPFDVHEVGRVLEGKMLQSTHLKKPHLIKVKTVCALGAHNITFESQGKVISIFEYFQQAYNITLQRPDLPLLVSEKDKKKCFHPMELYTIADNQRLGQKDITPPQVAEIIKVRVLLSGHWAIGKKGEKSNFWKRGK